jgi:phage terminase small subunit
MALTKKQALFVEEYLKDLNARKAALRAGYSPKTAHAIGAENLSKPAIYKAIEEAMQKRTERVRIDADTLLLRFVEELNADVNELYYKNGKVKPINQWPKIFRQGLVTGIETDKDGTIKVRFANRDKIKEMIGKHVDVQAFRERMEVITRKSHEQALDELDYGTDETTRNRPTTH